MKSILFIVNYFNDIDHNAPLIEELLNQNHKVILLCLTRYPLFNDPRIRYLNKFKNFHVLRLRALPRTGGLSNEKTGKLNVFEKVFRELIFSRIFALLILLNHDISHCIFTWGRPRAKGFQRQLFLAAKSRGIPNICLPHGQNIYINYDVNTYLRDRYLSGLPWPDFSSRNEFDAYVVQTQRHREMHLAWGMKPSRVHSLGSLRFSESWVQQNSSLYPAISLFPNEEPLTKIVFFLPHWRYNVDEEKTINLIATIVHSKDVVVAIKGHTRGDSVDKRHYEYLDKHDNLILSAKHDSTPLIRWADIVINFGSSIAIEAIACQKFVINPAYLHSNSTVFDQTDVALNATSKDEVVKLIRSIINNQIEIPTLEARSVFLNTEVYASNIKLNVAQCYLRFLLKYSKN